MALVVPKVGEVELLKRMFGMTSRKAGNLYVRLYVNDPTLSDDTNLASFTEVSDGGYTAVRDVAIAVDSITFAESVATIPQKTFILSGTTQYIVYGYYITVGPIGGSEELLWCERFPTPFNIAQTLGGEIRLTPKLELD